MHQSSQRKKNANLQDSGAAGNDTKRHNPKTHSFLTSLKSAFRAVFTLRLSGKSKTASKVIEHDDRKNISKVRGVSCKW